MKPTESSYVVAMVFVSVPHGFDCLLVWDWSDVRPGLDPTNVHLWTGGGIGDGMCFGAAGTLPERRGALNLWTFAVLVVILAFPFEAWVA